MIPGRPFGRDYRSGGGPVEPVPARRTAARAATGRRAGATPDRRRPAPPAERRCPGALDPAPRDRGSRSLVKDNGLETMVVTGRDPGDRARPGQDRGVAHVRRASRARRGRRSAAPTSRAGWSALVDRRSRPRPSTSRTPSASCAPAAFAASLTHIAPLGPIVKPFSGVAVPDDRRRSTRTPRIATGEGDGARVAVIDTGHRRRAARRRLADRHPAGHRRTTRRTHADDINVDPLDADPADGFLDFSAGHGTFVSGIVAQVAPTADITMYRALGTGGTGSEIEVACALIRAVRDGAQIVNLSLGTQTQFDQPSLAIAAALEVVREIERERGEDVLIVAAAGNFGDTTPDLAGGVPPRRLRRRAHGRPAPERVLEPRLVGRLRRPSARASCRPTSRASSPPTSPSDPRVLPAPTRSRGGAGRRSRPRRWPGPSRGSCTSAALGTRSAYVQLLATGRAAARLRPDLRDPAGRVKCWAPLRPRAMMASTSQDEGMQTWTTRIRTVAWDAPALVAGALGGDSRAWSEIVRRHTPAVVARVRQFRLTPHQAEDVAQTVWLNLLENLEKLRDPHALPGWIATTARHECIRVTNVNRRTVPVDPQTGRLDGVVRLRPRRADAGGRARAGAARGARGAARPPARHPADARGGPTAELRGDRRASSAFPSARSAPPGVVDSPACDRRPRSRTTWRPGRPPRLKKEDAMSWHSDDRAHSSTGPASPWVDDDALGADLIDSPGRGADLYDRVLASADLAFRAHRGMVDARAGLEMDLLLLELVYDSGALDAPVGVRDRSGGTLAHARLRGPRPRRRGGGRDRRRSKVSCCRRDAGTGDACGRRRRRRDHRDRRRRVLPVRRPPGRAAAAGVLAASEGTCLTQWLPY